MSDSGKLHRPGTPAVESGATDLELAYIPAVSADHTPQARFARVGAQRAAAAAQISRSLRVWRKAGEGADQQDQNADEGQAVSQPGEPAEQEADQVADDVADKLHGGDEKKGEEPGGDTQDTGAGGEAEQKGDTGQEKAPEIGAKLEGVGPKLYLSRSRGGDSGFVLAVDATGKVHGDLPSFAPKEWTKEQLEVSRDQLQQSINTRKREQERLGEHGPHRARITQEEALLRSIIKRLGELR